MESEFRMSLKQKADEEAIDVFAENLRQLLLTSPLGSKRILAIDPGYRSGCKVVCLDENGNLLFLQKADGASLNTIKFAQGKARHAAAFRKPSKDGADQLKRGELGILVFPDGFPNQGGLPIKVDGQTLGGIAISGAASEIDEAISQVALDALLAK